MVAYGFKQQFVQPIVLGRKPHTVRANRTGRSRHARPGEALQLYTAMRTKQCRLIGRAVCADVLEIYLRFYKHPKDDMVEIEGKRPVVLSALDEFAYHDGFGSWVELRAFWLKEHGALRRFEGTIIYWRDFVVGAEFSHLKVAA